MAGTPRALEMPEAAELARLARAAGAGSHPPLVVAITADASPELLAAALRAFDPDVVQLSGNEPIETVRAIGRRTWKVLHVPADGAGETGVGRGGARLARAGLPRRRAPSGSTSTRPVDRTRAGPGRAPPRVWPRRSPESCRSPWPVACTAANVAGALRSVAATGVDVASGVERPRIAGQRPTKDPFRVALFTKRARAARDDRPNIAFGPTPVHAGLLEADGAGRWGMERDFGGRYVPETLMAALEQLESAYDAVRQDPVFWAELRDAARDLRRSPDRALPGRPPGRGRPRRGGPTREARPTAAPARPASPASASTSSARTSPTRAPTRSTTRSARRC